MKKLLLTTALVSAAFVGPAHADLLKFFTGSTGYGGPFSGSGTVYNSIVTLGVASTCANNASPCNTGTADTITAASGTQTYGSGSDGLKAGGNTGVWDDTQPAFGGLGVGTGLTTQNDNIDGTDVLTLTFNQSVELTGVATLFDSGHGPFGDLTNVGTDTFLLNGQHVSFNAANGALLGALNLTGTVFTFAEDGSNPSFYVSGLSFTPGQTVGVPGPIVGAGLPGLVAACCTMLGIRRFRRRQFGTA